MLLHPLLQIHFKIDPAMPRLLRFLILFTKIMILMFICFLSIRNVKGVDELQNGDASTQIQIFLVFIAIIFLALIFLPIPSIFFSYCKKRFYLVLASKEEHSDFEFDDSPKKDKRLENNRIPVDPNLPIRLLFILNNYPYSSISKHLKDKIAYASGNSFPLAKKL